ncbi:MAG: ornithine carbamoyltransferase [Candidatus Chisholmbacteria bacterium]|nr:ornithine carbamoyltransferase [Candidatus Chisholmbacteria bacterium]
MLTKRDFLSINDINEQEFWQILKLAKKFKDDLRQGKRHELLKGKTLGMIFEKSSTRTRVSFETGMTQLGGHAIFLSPNDTQIGRGEIIADTARTLSLYVDLIMYRAFKSENMKELAKWATVPVINALDDVEHPCQILADLMTVWEHFRLHGGQVGSLKGLKLAYVGDCENNVTHSLALGCSLIGMEFVAAGPKGYHMNRKIVGDAKQVVNPEDAVRRADVVVTDTWVSMGDEAEKANRLKIFKPYQVNQKLMKLAKKSAIFLHCLPAYRGNEVTVGVIDGPQSLVWDEAENRLHTQKALMVWLLGK